MRIKAFQHRRAKIEIVPLIDVVFFLLATFVMVSLSMSRNQGMQVQLPSAVSSSRMEEPTKTDSLTLTVMEKGEVFFNKEKITLAQLPFKLQTFKASAKDPRVIVNADAGADFKHVVAVLDEARKLGIAKVGISSESR
jgi:biopolymer transport protein ExbD